MKILVLGGRGAVGARLVPRLRGRGHTVVAASRKTGVDILTGEGLGAALAGIDATVDLTEAPSQDDPEVTAFFARATLNLLETCRAAGVRHHVALSVVGADRIRDSAYFRAKAIQERLIQGGPVPFTALRTTQFFRIMTKLLKADGCAQVHVPDVTVRPVTIDDVADALADIIDDGPLGRTIELGGAEAVELHELARQILAAEGDPRRVVADSEVRFYGARLDATALLPAPDARSGSSGLRDWLSGFISAD